MAPVPAVQILAGIARRLLLISRRQSGRRHENGKYEQGQKERYGERPIPQKAEKIGAEHGDGQRPKRRGDPRGPYGPGGKIELGLQDTHVAVPGHLIYQYARHSNSPGSA